MTDISTSPSPNDPTVSGARSDGAAAFLQTGALPGFGWTTMDLGTVAKGTTRSVIWITFEIPLPFGTNFSGMSLSLERILTSGGSSAILPVWIGFLATDGTWNTGGEGGLGWVEYPNIESLPHPASVADAAWLGSSASLSHNVDTGDHSDGDIVTWGTNVPGLHYENAKLLTDLQTAFDANEVNRTSRGVPVAMAIVPTDTTVRLFRFSSAEAVIKPQLYIGVAVSTFAFDFTSFYPIEVSFATRVIDHEDGTEQRLRLMASGIHTFDAEEIAVDAARKAELEDFMSIVRGSTDTFPLTDPVTSSTYTVRFVESDTIFKHRPDARWDFQTSFVEVRK